MRRWLLIAGLALAAPLAARSAQVALIELEGPIGPAVGSFVSDASARAIEEGAEVIVLRVDTPGGLDASMRDIIKSILASPVPVLCWVGPGGARAASAGTFILYACQLSAMAPGTNLGAATPIPIGGAWPEIDPTGERDAAQDESGEEPPPTRDAAQAKAINDAVAYIRSLAERHGRNADWAEQAVRVGASLSATAAQEQDVIELIATSVDDLLQQADGRVVRMTAGMATLATASYELRRVEPDWRFGLLSALTNPTVAYLLLLIGIYGLLLEGFHPGAIVPGVVGAISLVLAAYALHVLPVNHAGLALILLGLVMLIVETISPGFGVLGLAGIVAFVLGSIFLMDTDVPGFQVHAGVIGAIATCAAGLLASLLWLVWRARQAHVVTGGEGMIGATVRAIEPIENEGWVEVQGERWRVRSVAPLRTGQQARVLARDGLVLQVEPREQEER